MSDFTENLRPCQPDGASTLMLERSQSSLPVEELANYLLNQDGFLVRQKIILPILEKEALLSKTGQQNLSRPDRFKLGLARAKLLRRLADQHGWSNEDYRIAQYLVDEMSPFALQMDMFLTTVRQQASDEQRKQWMPLIDSWKIIGAYAQTELGHGSNVRGLELQAKWDPRTKEFILHSPTLTASKWWNGSLGRTANYAIVVAQLLLPKRSPASQSQETEYISYGPHPFMVQVRDLETHQPLQGIVIGDIGPKYGYMSMDNGYMLFDNFRVPHSTLLARYASVDPDTGAYAKPKEPAVVYGSLTATRARIVSHAKLVLARAITVAVRYSVIRRQFPDRDSSGGPELQILDYPTVQIRILPLVATTFALHYAGAAMQQVYDSARENIEQRQDFSDLAHMHSMSSGLKSLCTTLAADGIEVCRRALGGHGFGGGSGLVQLNNDYLSKPTVEGDNWMITQQVALHAIKKMAAAVKSINKSGGDKTEIRYREYLREKQVSSGGQRYYDVLTSDSAIAEAFERRAISLVYHAYELRIVKKTPWTKIMIPSHRLSRALSQSILVSAFHEALQRDTTECKISPVTSVILRNLYRLFAFYTMDNEAYEFLNTEAVSQEQLQALPDKIQTLMERIRPHAVSIVDAWMIPDYLLDSALGRYDGRVYEDLFHRAHRLNPLNRITFNVNYQDEEITKGTGDNGLSILAKL
ncbi:Peroxisomal acyl-coenzyme A oxidase 1 [Talaromyces pinophilus]|nr:Peroxisomal acyl-coenzyme A oxidase 1 [Talaromyces pinophilus]